MAIARALAVEPQILVLDEPTSALDVSVRAEIINLLVRIQQEFQLSYVFISHDLSMVRHVSDSIAVMYLGRVVELGRYDAVFDKSLHPYTKALGDAVVLPDPERERAKNVARVTRFRSPLLRSSADAHNAPRCAYVEDRCREEAPQLEEKIASHFSRVISLLASAQDCRLNSDRDLGSPSIGSAVCSGDLLSVCRQFVKGLSRTSSAYGGERELKTKAVRHSGPGV